MADDVWSHGGPREVGCALAGGHSCEGAELALGFSVHGVAKREKLMKKGGMKPGQVLFVTKPIGTGTLFAADMRAKAEGRWVTKALDSMRKPSAVAAQLLVEHGAKACTDVTGFGLLGHLVEMCKGANLAAVLDLDEIPVLDGAEECLKMGITSSLQPANVRLSRAVANQDGIANNPRYPLIYDPQTAGGMLAAVPKENAEACIEALRQAGYPSTCRIGEIIEIYRGSHRARTGRFCSRCTEPVLRLRRKQGASSSHRFEQLRDRNMRIRSAKKQKAK